MVSLTADVPLQHSGERSVSSIKQSNENLHVDKKNFDLYLTSYIKTNFRWIIDLNVIGKITNYFHVTHKKLSSLSGGW